MTTTQQKATKKQSLVTVEGIPGTWRSMSGGGGTADVTKDWDGGATRPDLLSGPTNFDDIELVRTYKPSQDAAWVERLTKRIGLEELTITKQGTDVNGIKLGKPRTYPACLLIGLEEPEVDASSSDAAEIKLTFATSGPA
ncbi:tail tube protein [Arthrobacter phage Abba]|uniref:Tail tube protein n=1 Tax=Arthrobacter phage Abba TaxID=2713256 RepID=A0A6G8R2C7_9CAUD|nr:tail tube protein [Arthrobacter phage Abba]QIN94344.1 tail tube protein [Arthrobacter phage Abba]